MKTKALFLVRTIAIWLLFLGIVLIYLFGVSASHVVDFVSHESFGSVCGQVVSAEFGPVDFSYHGWILAGAAGALLLHTVSNTRLRVWISVACVIAPWFWSTGGFKGFAQWLLVMPATPLWTLQTVAGGADGEFYVEGFVIAVAVGWWMILWTLLGILDFRKLKRENENAVPREAERRFDRRSGGFKREPGASP